MSNVHDDRPTTSTEDPLAMILAELRTLGSRLDRLEGRLRDREAPGPNPVPLAPSLALRSDGKVLLAVEHVAGANIADRERWEGIVLSVTEAAEVFRAMSGAADDAAGHTAGRILWRGKKHDRDPGEGSDGGQG